MMDERKITVNVMKSIQTRFRDAFITKHADRSTVGIADFDVCTSGLTLWIEMKFLHNNDTLASKCSINQVILCHQRNVATWGKCLYVIFDDVENRVGIWAPQALFRRLKPSLAGPAPGAKKLGCNPYQISQSQFDHAEKGILRDLWEGRGAIEIVDIKSPLYHVVARMLEEFIG